MPRKPHSSKGRRKAAHERASAGNPELHPPNSDAPSSDPSRRSTPAAGTHQDAVEDGTAATGLSSRTHPWGAAVESSLRALTRRQRTILDAIVFLIRKGELPTVREVGALVGLRSPATVAKHLRVLEQVGLISMSGKSRGLRLAASELLEAILEDAALGDDRDRADAGLPARAGVSFGSDGETSSRVDRGTGDALREVVQSHLPDFARLASSARGRDGILGLFPLARGPGKRIPLVGAIAAGRPFESYSEGFARDVFTDGVLPDGVLSDGSLAADAQPERGAADQSATLAIDPRVFCEGGDVLALKIEGDSMVDAGILNGDYAIIRRQNTVEEGEIAAVIINGEGTLKRWRTSSVRPASGGRRRATVTLCPENEKFEPIEISEADGSDVLVIGKYVGLVRGNIQFM